ncbi:hypothetical protein ABZ694_24745 [Streptomyces albidoflavus]|uniref:hypothetical protein n=1 Tax=Streptomyces albidoflavus TaxID=1886 RepID=UPI00340577A7
MSASKAQQAVTAERRAKLIRMRLAGHEFDEIARVLEYSSASAASKDMIRVLEKRRDEQDAEVSVYRQQEGDRLDALLRAHWDAATSGDDPKAADLVLKIMDRRAKLMGLDMPVRAEVSGPDGGAVPLGTGALAELQQLISIAGQTGDPDTLLDGEQDTGDNTD